MDSNPLPLFPLNTVLFPGGVLPLRVFEVRYMDMVRDCLKRELPFGVCLITRGKEVGGAVATETVGCLAQIESWDMQQLGVLQLRTRGGQRFRITARSTQADGLQTATVDLLDADEDLPLAPAFRPCADLLRRVLDDLEQQRQGDDDSDDAAPIARPYQLDSAVWVGNRLCELLPVPLKAKQKLMELDDATARLEILTQYLRQHAVIK
jgi:Lon protease-like protein